MNPPGRLPNGDAAARKAIACPVLHRWLKTKGEVDQEQPSRSTENRLVVRNHRCPVVSQRWPATPAHRRGARPQWPPPRRLLLLPRSHPLPPRKFWTIFPDVGPGGLLPRRQAVSGLRGSAEWGGEGNDAHRSPYLQIQPLAALARAGGYRLAAKSALYRSRYRQCLRVPPGHSSHVTSRDLAGK